MTVAIVITNYNMPERTDALVEYIHDNVKHPFDIAVVDNGSDIEKPSKYTSVRLHRNVQTTNGWLMGLHYFDALRVVSGKEYSAYWFLITSAEFVGGDPLSPMCDVLQSRYDVVGVHPVLTQDSTTYWRHMKEGGDTWMMDNIASLYDAKWFDSIGRFDPALIYAWGIDLETGYKARSDGKKLHLCKGAKVKKVTDIGYDMSRMNMTAREREGKASENMTRILSGRYGAGWYDMMYHV